MRFFLLLHTYKVFFRQVIFSCIVFTFAARFSLYTQYHYQRQNLFHRQHHHFFKPVLAKFDSSQQCHATCLKKHGKVYRIHSYEGLDRDTPTHQHTNSPMSKMRCDQKTPTWRFEVRLKARILTGVPTIDKTTCSFIGNSKNPQFLGQEVCKILLIR